MPEANRALFGVISPEGVLLRVLPSEDLRLFRALVYRYGREDARAEMAARPKADPKVLVDWLTERLLACKLVRLG